MWTCVVFLLSLIITFSVSSPRNTKIYRDDYEYNKKTDAFYKFHIESRPQAEAGRVCEVEGASLMSPINHLDIVQLHIMFKRFPDIGNLAWVSEDGQDHESAEEPAIINLEPVTEEQPQDLRQCDVVSRQGKIETAVCSHHLPFICKVEASRAPYDSRCEVFGFDYKIIENIGSCYKIPRMPYSWNQAFAECKAQGSHLVVLNSVAEHDEVLQLMKTEPKVLHAQAWWFYFAGFRAQTPPGGTREFRTIFNQTLEEAGFAVWSENEPNNAKSHEDCGTVFFNNGNLNDVYCEHFYAYICEKELTPK